MSTDISVQKRTVLEDVRDEVVSELESRGVDVWSTTIHKPVIQERMREERMAVDTIAYFTVISDGPAVTTDSHLDIDTFDIEGTYAGKNVTPEKSEIISVREESYQTDFEVYMD